jgi:hypothetical protein
MIVRGWGGSVATAIGAAAAASAASLGLAYGMDVISWSAAVGDRASEAWDAGLAWAAWVAASSTIAGAVIAGRLGAQPGGGDSPPGRNSPPDPPGRPALRDVLGWLVVAVAAALGAAATVVLVAVPARVVEVVGVANPQTVAAGYALLGVLVGLPFAVGALAARAIAANLLATAGWLWLLAIAAVTDGVIAGRGWTRVPLAFWDMSLSGPWFRNLLLPDTAVAVGAALVIGALAALPAARRGDRPVTVAVSGVAGPLLVALAYLLAQPDLAGAAAVDLSRHLVAPYLVVAGLIGSLLVTMVRPRADPGASHEPADDATPAAAGAGTTGQGGTSGDGTSGDGTDGVPAPRGRRRQSASDQISV